MAETLSGTLLIARRELGAYFNTIWGYVVVSVLLLIDGVFFNAFAMGSAPKLSSQVLHDFFNYSSGVTMIAAVLLTIRLFAEERQTGTMTLLDGAPLTEGAVVVGKFLSAFAFLVVMVLLTAYMPALVLLLGKVSFGQICAGYLGLLSLGAAALALGAFASALTKSQVVAGVLGGALVVALLLMWMLARVTEAPFSSIFEYVSFWDRHFKPFMSGHVETESLVFYATVTALGLFGTTQVLAWRRRR